MIAIAADCESGAAGGQAMRWIRWFGRWMAIAGLLLAPGFGPALAAAPDPAVPGGLSGTIVKPLTGNMLTVKTAIGTQRSITIGSPDDLALAAKGQAGDRLVGIVADVRETPGQPVMLTKLQSIDRPVADGPRIFAFVLAAALLLAAAALACSGRPQAFLLGADGRYSNSQTQLATWFGLVAVAYFATLCLRVYVLGADYLGGIEAPERLILLSGLSAFAFGGAKVISVNKGGAGPDANAAVGAGAGGPAVADPLALAGAPGVAPAHQPAVRSQSALKGLGKGLVRFVSDLTTSGGGGPDHASTPDIGDFQMILITLVAAGIFILTAYHQLQFVTIADRTALPDVDSGMLASFGLGQGAYLLKKAATPPGQG